MSIRVLLADDHKIVREGYHFILENQSGIEVVAEADDGLEAVNLTKETKPNVVVMDITMPGMNGIVATQRILHENPETNVLILSMHSDCQFVVEVLRAGAKGYLRKNCSSQELVDAIRTVADNKIYLDAKITEYVVKEYVLQHPETAKTTFSSLSIREKEVLQLLAEGNNSKEIAYKLDINIKTVDYHRSHIMKKLNLFSVAELTKYAVREGLTSV